MKRPLAVALAGVAVFVVFNLVHAMLQSPQETDMEVIKECWLESKNMTHTQQQRQVVIEACQALEKAYQFNYGTIPSLGKTST